MTRRLVVLAGLLSLTSLARAGVIVVDPGGGPGGNLLHFKLSSAADGDILLIRAGDYSMTGDPLYKLEGKSLTLIGDNGGVQVEIPGLLVRGTAADQPVVLRGLHFTRGTGDGYTGIIASLAAYDCNGVVWIEDCAIDGRDATLIGGFSLNNAGHGLDIHGSARVVLARCTITGGRGLDLAVTGTSSTQGFSGILAVNSFFAACDTESTGGDGGSGLPQGLLGPLAWGGPGVELGHADMVASGCHFVGGDDLDGSTALTMPGSGISSFGPCNAFLRGTTVEAGAEQPGELPVAASTLPPEHVITFPAAPRSLAVASPLREGQPAVLEIDGVDGDDVWLLASLGSDFTAIFGKQGVLSLEVPPFFIALATHIFNPSGHLSIPFVVPTLPASLDGIDVYLQTMSFGIGGPTLGAPTCLVWIDSSF